MPERLVPTSDLREIATTLRRRSGGLRCRTGVMLIPLDHWEDLPDLAARAAMPTIDHAERLAASLPSQTRFVDISADTEITRLQALAGESHSGDPVLVYNFDIALSRLPRNERVDFWTAFIDNLPYTRHGLVVALPEAAQNLFPQQDVLDRLMTGGRMAVLQMPSPQSYTEVH